MAAASATASARSVICLCVLWSVLHVSARLDRFPELSIQARVDDSSKGDFLKLIDGRCLESGGDPWPEFVEVKDNGQPKSPETSLKICDVYGIIPYNWKFLLAGFLDKNQLSTSTGESFYFSSTTIFPQADLAMTVWPWVSCSTRIAVGSNNDAGCPQLTPGAHTEMKYLGLEDGKGQFSWFCVPGSQTKEKDMSGELLLMRLALPASSTASAGGTISIFGTDEIRTKHRFDFEFKCFDDASKKYNSAVGMVRHPPQGNAAVLIDNIIGAKPKSKHPFLKQAEKKLQDKKGSFVKKAVKEQQKPKAHVIAQTAPAKGELSVVTEKLVPFMLFSMFVLVSGYLYHQYKRVLPPSRRMNKLH